MKTIGIFLSALVIANAVVSLSCKPRIIRSKDACINGLRQIDGAKEQWALENKKTAGDTPTPADLYGTDKYLKVPPKCPQGGKYSLNAMSNKPTCSMGVTDPSGHAL